MLREETRLEVLKLAVEIIRARPWGGSGEDLRVMNIALLERMRDDDTGPAGERTRSFIRALSPRDQTSLSKGKMPEDLMEGLKQMAHNEIERRRMTR